MNSKLKLVSTATMSHEDWLSFRYNGLGGSDISTVLGLNPYMSSHKLFYQKLGEVGYDEENIHMFWGNQHEDKVAEMWQYFDPESQNKENYIKNYNDANIIRKCRRVNAYITNPEMPWGFASVDRLINKDDSGKEGVLECKTISAYAAKVWDAGIPPMYYAQLQWYLMITELDYGELASLKDGKYFEVIPFIRNDEFIEMMKQAAAGFWDRVTRARILKSEGKPYEQLEPEIDNQEAYKEFLSERFKAEDKKIVPSAHFFDCAVQIKNINEQIDALKEDKTALENEIKEYMKDSDTMDFGASGKITWKQNKASMKFDKDAFKEAQPNLYDNYCEEEPGPRVLRLNIKIDKEAKAAA